MEVLKDTDFLWHADQPDVPGKSAQQMKEFFDAPTRALMKKVNEIIGGEEAPSLAELTERTDFVTNDMLILREDYENFKLMEYSLLQSTVAELGEALRQLGENQNGGTVGEDTSAGLSDWKTLHTQNGMATYYDDITPLEVTGFSCKEVRGVFNVKGGWDIVSEDMRSARLRINDCYLEIGSLCGEMTVDAPDVLFEIRAHGYPGASYLEVRLKQAPYEYNDQQPQANCYTYLLPFDGQNITSMGFEVSYTQDYDTYAYNFDAKFELEGR